MVLSLTSGCARYDDSYYGRISTNPGSVKSNSMIDVVAAFVKDNAYSVPSQDRDQHEQCVYFALDNMFMGESCDWYSSNGSTRGKVQVVAHRPQGSGHCTTLYNSVFHKEEWANWQETACTTAYSSQWKFVPR